MPAKKTAKKTTKKAAVKKAKKPAAAKSKPEKTVKKELIDCQHCEGTGKCSAGKPFSKSRAQGVFKDELLVSCPECLIAAGKSPKSKKMVKCRICQGSGKVEK
ncbi:MAG: hypothetical protein J7K40_01775 [candidate division Zixibacteria bacterium]|nr:hypothetical protein [candidate division Zixibacteria bacterium]